MVYGSDVVSFTITFSYMLQNKNRNVVGPPNLAGPPCTAGSAATAVTPLDPGPLRKVTLFYIPQTRTTASSTRNLRVAAPGRLELNTHNHPTTYPYDSSE